VNAPLDALIIRQLAPGDAPALAAFYNGLSARSIRTFRPLGLATDVEVCRGIVRDDEAAIKFDLLALDAGQVVGWCFVWELASPEPTFGLAVADAWQGRGLGSRLMERVMREARERGLAEVFLTVVQDNAVAWRLYEKQGFVRCGEFVGQDGLPYFRMRACLRPVDAPADSRSSPTDRPSSADCLPP
jgi:ribosomal protein S18 acetylase RimI-like enzyme